MSFTLQRSSSCHTCQPIRCLQPANSMRFLILLFSFAALGGCASANGRFETLNAEIAKPINCEHAQMQLDLLEDTKVSRGEKIVNSIASILPTSIILNLLTGEYASRAKIASGKFDSTLYMKINAIHKECDEFLLSDMPGGLSEQMINSDKLAHTAKPPLPK